MTMIAATPDDSQAKRNVAVLVAAQAILGCADADDVHCRRAGRAIAGQQSLPCNAADFTDRSGFNAGGHADFGHHATLGTPRRVSSGINRRCLQAASSGAYGLYLGSFPIFLLGSFLTGIYMSAHGFYRFAAADTASDAFRPKAISYVMAGGLAAAIIGPQIVKLTSTAYVIPFLGTYLAVIAINVSARRCSFSSTFPTPEKPTEDAPKGRTRLELLKTPRIAVAIICAMVSYALMNLVMTSTPLAVVGLRIHRR